MIRCFVICCYAANSFARWYRSGHSLLNVLGTQIQPYSAKCPGHVSSMLVKRFRPWTNFEPIHSLSTAPSNKTKLWGIDLLWLTNQYWEWPEVAGQPGVHDQRHDENKNMPSIIHLTVTTVACTAIYYRKLDVHDFAKKYHLRISLSIYGISRCFLCFCFCINLEIRRNFKESKIAASTLIIRPRKPTTHRPKSATCLISEGEQSIHVKWSYTNILAMLVPLHLLLIYDTIYPIWKSGIICMHFIYFFIYQVLIWLLQLRQW